MHTWLGSENLTLTRFDFLRTFYPPPHGELLSRLLGVGGGRGLNCSLCIARDLCVGPRDLLKVTYAQSSRLRSWCLMCTLRERHVFIWDRVLGAG